MIALSPPTSPGDQNEWISDVLGKIFGWTSGATLGTLFTIAKRGEPVGSDEFGNRYFQSRDTSSYDGRRRRWVVYNGYADASKVPPDWHGWLHYTFDEPPTEQPLPRRVWEKDHLPNLTGTPMAWRPQGSLAAEGRRPAATGDYEGVAPRMNRKSAILGGVTALALLASGVVVASALNDLPQDAQPASSPTADLNRQPTPPASQEPAPREAAPEAAPAPAAPIAITPPAPVIVVAAADDGKDAPKEPEVEEEAEDEPVTPADPVSPPGRRTRRPVAIIEAVDKVTAETMRFEVEVGGRPVQFQKTLIFTARACEVSASDEMVPDSIAYLEVSIQPRGVLQTSGPRQIFRGWMFASAPAVSGLQHPIYDAWVVGCRA